MLRALLRNHLVAMLLLATGAGCGSNEESKSSGVDGSKKLIELTDAEKGEFCDWSVAKIGGYDDACDGKSGGYMTYPDKNACVMDAPNKSWTPECQATVSEAEACVNALPRCPTDQQVAGTPSCTNLRKC